MCVERIWRGLVVVCASRSMLVHTGPRRDSIPNTTRPVFGSAEGFHPSACHTTAGPGRDRAGGGI